MALEIIVLTLNVWGIPYVSHNREARMQAIADQLASGQYDVVSLQEVWSESDYRIIKEKTENVLPYSHYFHSGVIGAGLCVLSKYPIVSAFFHAWSVNGYFHRIQHADWFGGKGVGLCRILIKGKIVNVYNAHLHAEYDNENDEYKTHRIIQSFDTAQFIQSTRGQSVLQILAADLNTQPNEISYRTVLHTSKMIDCCIVENIGTNECARNSYSTPSALKKNPVGLRIDHIFARAGKKFQIYVAEYKLPFPERIPGNKFSYSDHEAVAAKIIIENRTHCLKSEHLTGDNSTNSYCLLENKKENELRTIESLEECIELCESSLRKLKTDRILYYSISILITFVLIALMDYHVPYGFTTLYLFLRFLLFSLVLFSLFMATIWNHMERNGILSGKHSMEIYLKSLKQFPRFQD